MKNDPEKPTILIVDDDEQIRNLLAILLSDDYECTKVASAEDALAIVAREEFDLIISDINMGGLSGLDLLPYLQRACPHAVVLMISGTHTIEAAIEAMRGGAFDYITKPLEINHVEAAVARASAGPAVVRRGGSAPSGRSALP